MVLKIEVSKHDFSLICFAFWIETDTKIEIWNCDNFEVMYVLIYL
jgi:hypothetical protein